MMRYMRANAIQYRGMLVKAALIRTRIRTE